MLVLFINITLLEFTPLFVVAVLILVCTVYMARGGVEVTARTRAHAAEMIDRAGR